MMEPDAITMPLSDHPLVLQVTGVLEKKFVSVSV